VETDGNDVGRASGKSAYDNGSDSSGRLMFVEGDATGPAVRGGRLLAWGHVLLPGRVVDQ
jgi:hypothetical protein